MELVNLLKLEDLSGEIIVFKMRQVTSSYNRLLGWKIRVSASGRD